VTIDAAPFSPLGASPEPSALVRLAATPAGSANLPAFGFLAPSEPGEWVVRVVLTFATDPGPSSQDSFFRLRVDTPAPVVGGSATAPVACGRPGAHPPAALLSVNGGSWVAGERGSYEWGTTAGDAPPPTGTRVEIAQGTTLTLKIEDDLCAAWWSVQLAARPGPDQDPEPFLDLVPPYPWPVNPGEANRFELDSLPPGDWVIGAWLEFANSNGDLNGQTTNYWSVLVR
jgi:hypothetical protein